MSKRQKIGFVLACFLCLSLVIQFSPTAADSPREILRLGRGTANALDWRPDRQIGARAVLGGVQLYDADYHETALLNVPELNEGQLSSLNWSPDGHFLAVDAAVTASNQEPAYTTYVWEIGTDGITAQQKFTVPEKSYGSHVSWKPDSSQIAVGARVFDVQTGQLAWTHHYGLIQYDVQTGVSTRSERNRAEKTDIFWSPDGKRFIAIYYAFWQSERVTYAVFADTSDEFVSEFQKTENSSSAAFTWSPDGSKIADTYGRTWDTQTGIVATTSMPDDADFNSPFLSSTRNQIIWSANSKSFILLSTGITLPGTPSSVLYRVDTLTRTRLYKKSFWQYIKLVDWKGEAIEAYSNNGHHLFINAVTGDVFSAERTNGFFQTNNLAWSPDSTKLVTIASGPVNYPLQLWDIEASRTTGEPTLRWTANDDWFAYEANAARYAPDYAKVRWGADGQDIITISKNVYVYRTFDSVERWNIENGASLGRLYFSEAAMPPMAEPSPDMKLLAQTNTYWYTYDSEKSHTVQILSSDTLQTRLSFESANADIIAWSPDGQRLAAVGLDKSKTEIWNIGQESAQLLATLDTASDDGAEWSPDGSMIVIGTHIYDPTTGKLISLLAFESPYRYWVEWNQNSRVIALYGYGQPQVSFYDVRTGKLIQAEAVPSQYVTAVAWSPDGTMLAVGLDDGTIRIWDVSDLK